MRESSASGRDGDDRLQPGERRRATRRLPSPEPPTAIVFDSDLLAVTGLGVAQQMGFAVPDDVSIVGWDDSLISQVVHPPLTAITRDITAYGVLAAKAPARRDRRQAEGDVETTRATHAPGQHRPAVACARCGTEPRRVERDASGSLTWVDT